MCGRYQFTNISCEEIRWITRAIDSRYGPGAWQPGEIAPSMAAPVLVQGGGGQIRPVLLQWGYPVRERLVINARVETAAQKPLFREGVKRRRCVVPCTGFFEWDAARRRYLFSLPGETVLHMAGLYREDGRYCILTTAANASMEPVHDRMPQVLRDGQWETWLRDADSTARLLTTPPPALEAAEEDGQLCLW